MRDQKSDKPAPVDVLLPFEDVLVFFPRSVQDLGRLPEHGLVSQSFALSVLKSGLSSPLTESGFNQGDTGIFHEQIKVPAWSFCCPEITGAPQDTVLLLF